MLSTVRPKQDPVHLRLFDVGCGDLHELEPPGHPVHVPPDPLHLVRPLDPCLAASLRLHEQQVVGACEAAHLRLLAPHHVYKKGAQWRLIRERGGNKELLAVVLRIRDVYPGFLFSSIPDPGPQISGLGSPDLGSLISDLRSRTSDPGSNKNNLSL